MKCFISSLFTAACLACFARDMPISNGRLVNALNANQQMITNLPSAFWEGHGGGGMSTNAVQAIIEKNVETNYLCTVAAAQSMTNDPTIVRIGNLDRGLVVSPTGTVFKFNSSNVGSVFTRKLPTVASPSPAYYDIELTRRVDDLGEDPSNVALLDGVYIGTHNLQITGLVGPVKDISYSVSVDAYTKLETDTMLVNKLDSTKFSNPTYGIVWRDDGLELTNFTFLVMESFTQLRTKYAEDTRGLPYYLANGDWNTASDPFAKLSDIPTPDFTTNNAALVSTITNLAPSKARGISLADPVRHCNWYQCVTNGVFFWLVED